MSISIPTYHFLRLPEVSRIVGFGRSSIYERIAAGTFPAPVKVGHSSRWRSDAIAAWLDAHQPAVSPTHNNAPAVAAEASISAR